MLTVNQIRFVLCETTHPGNIGAAARALKTMGFGELVLVAPRHFPHADADARASGALDVLTSARVVDDLAAAVADCALVVATTARHRRANRPQMDSRAAVKKIVPVARQAPVAIVFGTESAGLTNEQLDLCQLLINIPANPEYSSLNLAAAVQLIAYEMSYELAQKVTGPDVDGAETGRVATSADMEHFYAHLQTMLVDTGFLQPDQPRQLMRKLRLVFDRAELDEHELKILRGILSSVTPYDPDLESADNSDKRYVN